MARDAHCRQRPHVRNTQYFQRASGMLGLLVDILHHGSAVLQREVLQVRRRRGGDLTH